MGNPNLDLNLLNTFIAVVETGSMTQAAKRLKQPISRVSRAILRLEGNLNQHLILRTTRSFQVTEAGRNLFREVQPLLRKISELQRNMDTESDELTGVIRITAPEDFGQNLLGPVVSELSVLHPRLEIDLNLTDDFVDLVRTETDIGIRAGKLRDSTLKAKYLGESYFVFIASPEYIHKYGSPKKPQEISDHRCIYFPVGPSSKRNEWVVTNGVKKENVQFNAMWRMNHKGVAIQLAKKGLGITLAPNSVIGDLFETKELVQVLPNWSLEPAPVHIVYPPQRILSRKVRTVSQFLEEKLKPLFKSKP